MSNTVQYVDLFLFSINAVVSIVFVCMHGRRLYQDFFTEDRNSVYRSRRKKPKITQKYKFVGWFTFMSCLFYSLALIFSVITFSISKTLTICQISNVGGNSAHQLGKLFTYYVFLIRLDMIYGESSHGYRRCTLIFLGIVGTIFAIEWIVAQFTIYVSLHLGDPENLYSFDEGKFPFSCDEAFGAITPLIFYSIFILFDLIMNILYSILFIVPLKKSIKLIQLEEKDLTETSKKMLGVAAKVTILTATLCLSTIIAVLCVMIMQIKGLYAFNGNVNVICLILMTPYYNDKKWYRRLFFLCRFCCDRNGYSTKQAKTTQQEIGSTTPKTADTIGAISSETNLSIISSQSPTTESTNVV